jgi:hypothetical protein
MKKLLLGLLLFSATAQAQITQWVIGSAAGGGGDTAHKYPKMMYTKTFDVNASTTGSWQSAGITFDGANQRVQVVTNNLGFDGLIFYPSTQIIAPGQKGLITVDVDIDTLKSVYVFSTWPDFVDSITVSGTYTFEFTAGSTVFPIISAGSINKGRFYVKHLSVFYPDKYEPVATKPSILNFQSTRTGNKKWLSAGNRNKVKSSTSGTDITSSITVGFNSDAGSDIGGQIYGSNSSIEQVVPGHRYYSMTQYTGSNFTASIGNSLIGDYAFASGWRLNTFGNYAFNLGVSNNIMGDRTWAIGTHLVAVGKAAHAFQDKTTDNILIDAAIGDNPSEHVFFGSAHSHRKRNHPITGIPESGDYVPANEIVRIYGASAYDDRAVPSEFNVGGGHIRIVAGLPTGSGTPGTVGFAGALSTQASPGNNKRRQDVLMLSADGQLVNTTTDTPVLIYYGGSLRRIKVGAEGSGAIGGTSRALYIE